MTLVNNSSRRRDLTFKFIMLLSVVALFYVFVVTRSFPVYHVRGIANKDHSDNHMKALAELDDLKRDLKIETAPLLTTRGKINSYFCYPVRGQPWGPAELDEAAQCMKTLSDANHDIAINPGCQTICATGGSVIEACNDTPSVIEHGSFDLATFAFDIMYTCSFSYNGRSFGGGQQFDTDGFNVIVRGYWSVA